MRIEYTADEDRAGGASDGVGGPGEGVEGGEALEAEVAAKKVGCDVALTAHAESDETGRDKARGQAIGHRQQHDAQHSHEEHNLRDAGAKEAVQKDAGEKASD
jgi:hypothetical protein